MTSTPLSTPHPPSSERGQRVQVKGEGIQQVHGEGGYLMAPWIHTYGQGQSPRGAARADTSSRRPVAGKKGEKGREEEFI